MNNQLTGKYFKRCTRCIHLNEDTAAGTFELFCSHPAGLFNEGEFDLMVGSVCDFFEPLEDLSTNHPIEDQQLLQRMIAVDDPNHSTEI